MASIPEQIRQSRRDFLDVRGQRRRHCSRWRRCSRTRGCSRPTAAARGDSPHFAPKAKACICIYLEGAPSQIDLFDPKPKLNELHGQPLPESFTKNVRFAFIQKETARILGCPRKFAKHGQCGMEFSDFLPHLGDVRGRHRADPVDAHRAVQPPPRPADDELRRAARSAGRAWARG